ncbi:hypothetical protein VE03_10578 [Pseudogymnoascus sp. 23342-1-I1]|nr:hypothetical protein VE03_10578 [Pseudogymnoascus sp. 23342-1-I1]
MRFTCNGSRTTEKKPAEKQWEKWAEGESMIRLAYVIFVHKVDYTIHFMTPANPDLKTLDLPLPAPSSLWLAESAADWSYQAEMARKPPRHTFQSALKLLIANGNKPRRREALKIFSSNAFTLHILIHGVASAIRESV